MRKDEALMGAALVLVGLIMVWQATRVSVGWTDVGPGAGFFPFWLSVGVALCGFILTVQSLQGVGEGARKATSFIPLEARKPLLVAFVPMVVLVATIRYLGIYLGGALYIAGYMVTVGRHRWWSSLLVGTLVPAALFFIFEKWFLLPMPKGALLEHILYGG